MVLAAGWGMDCRRLAPIAVALLPLLAAAQSGPVYKYRLPDGSTLYSDEARSNGELQEIITPPAAPQAAPAAQARAQTAPAERAAEQDAGALDAATREVQAARQSLDAAQAALDSGVEPQPGERIGNANGTSRLAPGYWQRIGLLRAEVARAKERLEQANAQLQAAR
jgi:hypothetical protein